MTPLLSLHLDAVRFLAALVVFLGHVSGQRFTGGFLWQLAPYTNQAVTVFFVLSGFVIAYVTVGRDVRSLDYFLARGSRVYSVAVPALLITFILDSIGFMIAPELYQPWWGYQQDGKILQFVTALIFVGQNWWWGITPGSNLPYWSLQYEVWYYVLFGVFLFAPPRWRNLAVLSVMLCAGPPIIALLPLWLLGVGVYRLCEMRPLARRTGVILAISSVLTWIIYELIVDYIGRPLIGNWFYRSMLIEDYIVGGLFALHVWGVHGATIGLRAAPRFIAVAVRWLAGATFTLYLLHLPVAQFLAALAPWPAAAWPTRTLVLFGTLAAVFLVAEFTERRKDVWRQALFALVPASLRHKAEAAQSRG